MWNVDFTGTPAEAGQAVREAVNADAESDPSLVRIARVFGKYLGQLTAAWQGTTVHVVTTGTLTPTGATAVTYTCEVS